MSTPPLSLIPDLGLRSVSVASVVRESGRCASNRRIKEK